MAKAQEALERARSEVHAAMEKHNKPGKKGKNKTHDPYWWGYIDDGQGWTARPKSAYMKTPEYNPELRRKLKKERKERKQEAKEVEKRMRREWLEGSRVSKKVETG
ncbi:uncharacterized protein ASPGLDRAFT_38068 [Aspergillus glaucus CBS 516.65]|uniref:Uncharacterized protein n=1 Tax=Aspergillus glaucus CBS 516.65 TaxID=1160497 RepID=A0A1L9VBG1_ASPGL|nr:hypothetical protein ASPGLDRAFT_38068 [Aspergillus glaucus CBS 516.65]OJJ81277.1 hypothetical protein ASPGLDRAFT_38068 [Aspergillus glaucus CBS 516.65]